MNKARRLTYSIPFYFLTIKGWYQYVIFVFQVRARARPDWSDQHRPGRPDGFLPAGHHSQLCAGVWGSR